MDPFTFSIIIFTVIFIMIFLSLCKKEPEPEQESVIIEHLPKYELEAPPPDYDQI